MPSQTIHLYSLAFERSLRFAAMQHGTASGAVYELELENIRNTEEAQLRFLNFYRQINATPAPEASGHNH